MKSWEKWKKLKQSRKRNLKQKNPLPNPRMKRTKTLRTPKKKLKNRLTTLIRTENTVNE